MKRIFHCIGEKSENDWAIEVDGVRFTIYSDEYGEQGQTQTTSFENEKKCRAAADKMIAEKVREEGYVEDEKTCQIAGIGRHVQIKDKRTLEEVILNYDENGTKLGVTNFKDEDKIYEYDSSAELLQAISDFKNKYGDDNYVWMWQCTESPKDMERILKISTIKLYPKPAHLDLLTPYGQPTGVELMSEGQKKIPCRKRVFFKGYATAVLYCDAAGKRILRLVPQTLKKYDTDAETQAAFETMKNNYIKNGYELTFDGIVDYAFDYWINDNKVAEDTIKRQKTYTVWHVGK